METTKPQDLELTGQPEEDTDEEEDTGSVDPGGEDEDEEDSIECKGEGEGERYGDSREEDDLVGEFDEEGRKEDVGQVAERFVELAGVVATNRGGVMLECIKEKELPQPVLVEEPAFCVAMKMSRAGKSVGESEPFFYCN